jgi:Zn-dependent peptidase ImmA (M78 family)/DNA-binding XRE family transcriptional regulator
MGFNGARLAIARKRRHFTKKSLAADAEISQVHLTRIESGETAEPEPETVQALSRALSYPVEFFYLGDCVELRAEAASFRSLSSMTSRQRDAALASGTIAFELDDWVTERFDLPAPDLLDLRDEDPAAAAAAIRSRWSIGSKPIPHLNRLLEAKGIRVFSLAEGNKSVDAFSCWNDSTPYMFLNTFKSAERSRFDAAHELGHLVLHRHGGARDVEKEADQFAAAFLIPRGDLIGHLPRVQSLSQLVAAKERWGVSVAALARNVFEAGLVSEWTYRELCRQISMRGYRTNEPNARPREESVLWRKVFESLWRDRKSKEHVARELRIPIDEIQALISGLFGDIEPSTPKEPRKQGLHSV